MQQTEQLTARVARIEADMSNVLRSLDVLAAALTGCAKNDQRLFAAVKGLQIAAGMGAAEKPDVN